MSPSDGARVGREGSEARTAVQGRSASGAVLTVEQAERLAAATFGRIDAMDTGLRSTLGHRRLMADRERVESDLAGLRAHSGLHRCPRIPAVPCADARRYSDGLRRTAALYGVTT